MEKVSRRQFLKYASISSAGLISLIVSEPKFSFGRENYDFKTLATRIDHLKGLAINPADNKIYFVQKINKGSEGVCELFGDSTIIRFLGAKDSKRPIQQTKIAINSRNQILIYSQNLGTEEIDVYDLNTKRLKLTYENPFLSSKKETIPVIEDVIANPADDKFYFANSQTSSIHVFNPDAGTFNDSGINYKTNWDAFTNICFDKEGVFYGADVHKLDNPNFLLEKRSSELPTIAIQDNKECLEMVVENPWETVGKEQFNLKCMRHSNFSRELFLAGTMISYDHKTNIPTGGYHNDYVLKLDLDTRKIKPIAMLARERAEIVSLDSDKQENIYLGFNILGDPGHKSGQIIKISKM